MKKDKIDCLYCKFVLDCEGKKPSKKCFERRKK